MTLLEVNIAFGRAAVSKVAENVSAGCDLTVSARTVPPQLYRDE